ncbi:oxidation resistance protein 1 isoform X5 [Cryptotermes secundus]|uniref:oxidation resistance protein 1 isoform X5 n=1 Tax=Cryptotermes secundus TaxID=105785 RepID=UPI000CD7C319|nr:oxidation resistance protein 1 isoform X5 [Cryptotermes secundus]
MAVTMETEWYVHASDDERDKMKERQTTVLENNNPTSTNSGSQKQWSTSSIPGLVNLEESIIMEQCPTSAVDKRGRRKSWHIKMERKRRKGVMGGSPGHGGSGEKLSDRHKRPSWWNIFVPDHWPSRSRRASQDITRTSDSIVPWQRSKSRSVDHGFSPPFDLDSLRSKVEGRFESVGRDSDGGGGGGSGKEVAALTEKKMGRSLPPVNTITYTVKASDTLTSVAARFDTTPSELTKLNRLTTRLIFPGQVLYVPDKQGSGTSGDERPGTNASDGDRSTVSTSIATHHLEGDTELPEEKDILDNLRPVSPKLVLPGHIEHVVTPLSPLTSHTGAAAPSSNASDQRLVANQRNCERFLKINVRHITDGQGVVCGVLLVTPNAVMFDPNVSDPLVIEHGPESYGVIAPMEFVVNAAIYYDIAHMRVGHTSDLPRSDVPKPEIYHAHGSRHKAASSADNPQNSPGKDSLLVKDETFPELARARSSSDNDDENESVCSCGASGREGDAFPKAFERDLVTPTNLMLLSSSDNEASDGQKESSRQVSFESSCSSVQHQKSLSDGTDGINAKLTEGEKMEDADDDKTPVDTFQMLEERRRSCLDHHWAIPSVDRSSVDKENGDIMATYEEKCSTSKAGICEDVAGSDETDRRGQLVKLSCHDSGIDIRDTGVLDSIGAGSHVPPGQVEPDPVLPLQKKVFSDAEIINASRNDWIPPKTVAQLSSVTDTVGIQSGDAYNRKKTSSVSFSLDSNADNSGEGTTTSDGKEGTDESGQKSDDPEKHESRKNKMLKRLSYPLAWVEGLTSEKDEKEALSSVPNSADSQHHSSVFSKVFSRRSSVGTFIRPHSSSSTFSDTRPHQSAAPKLDYRSMVSVDDMPELFVSFDKLIPRPARSCEDPPLYLRLRMGRPINKKIPKSTPIMSYGKKKMRPEYWFSVPRNRVDDLYNFLLLWVPHLYGELEEMDPKSRGYELVESDTELWEDEAGESGPAGKDERRASDEGELTELTRESWEVLSMSEELRRALYASNAASLDIEPFIPDLVGVTEIFSEEHRKKLCRHLPARAEGYVWTLVFSTSQHGFSLNSMYRKMSRLESPILMVIEDTEHNVFGALTSCALKVSDHFYGTGESLLFRFTPEFQVFNWTGDNMYFIKGNNESLAIGAGDGKFGLWLDGDLYQGRTQRCSTYGNEPLAPQEDFVVKTMECWAFI